MSVYLKKIYKLLHLMYSIINAFLNCNKFNMYWYLNTFETVFNVLKFNYYLKVPSTRVRVKVGTYLLLSLSL